MRTFKIELLLLIASCSLTAFGQSAQTPNQPATADDMAIAEVVLSEVAKNQDVHGMMGSRDATQIAVYNKGYENFTPTNPNIRMSDLKDLSAALEKARAEPGYLFELDYSVSSEVFQKFIPTAKAIVDIGRPQYSKKGSAMISFSYGPLPHGSAQCTYTLAKKRGKWKIVKKKISIPM